MGTNTNKNKHTVPYIKIEEIKINIYSQSLTNCQVTGGRGCIMCPSGLKMPLYLGGVRPVVGKRWVRSDKFKQ